jgi:hypothetical protein
MHYSKKAHCSSGKLLSWNKMGPQGAQGARGAQGAQGPPGVANVGYAYNTNQPLVYWSRSSSSNGYSGIVDTFVPTVAGSYLVNTADTLEETSGTTGQAYCLGFGKTSITEPMRATLHDNSYVPLATTGVVFASPANPVGNYCSATVPTTVNAAAVDGIQASKVNGATPAVRAKSSASPKQYFRQARALGLKKVRS